MQGADSTPKKLTGAILFARLVSVLFHPGFIPFYFLVPYSANKSHQGYILGGSFLLLAFLPLLGTIFYLRAVGERNLYTVSRKRRFVPFGLHAVGIAVFGWVMETALQGYLPMRWVIFVFAFNALGFLITLFWKISLHMMGISAVAGLIAATGGLFPWEAWVITGLFMVLIAWARLFLRSHDYAQIIAGTLVGFLVTFAAWKFGWI